MVSITKWHQAEFDIKPFLKRQDFEDFKTFLYEEMQGGAVVTCFCRNVKFLVCQRTKNALQMNDEFFEKPDAEFWRKVYRNYSEATKIVMDF